MYNKLIAVINENISATTGGNMKTKASAAKQLAAVQTMIDMVKAGNGPSGTLFVAPAKHLMYTVSRMLIDQGITTEIGLASQGVDLSVKGEVTGAEGENTSFTTIANLKDMGNVQFVIIDHSEESDNFRAKWDNEAAIRHQNYERYGTKDTQMEFIKELDNKARLEAEMLYFAQKAEATMDAGMRPVICYGETADERYANVDDRSVFDDTQKDNVDRRIRTFLTGLTQLISKEKMEAAIKAGKAPVFAYEPKWAIGDGNAPATAEQKAHAYKVTMEVLEELYGPEIAAMLDIEYGGSESPQTAPDSAVIGYRGALVGGYCYKDFEGELGLVGITHGFTDEARYNAMYEKALEIGRPPVIKELFPNSKALIVSGKIMARTIAAKGNMTVVAANGRNDMVIRGALKGAQKAGSAIMIEIAKSEGGIKSKYCPHSFLQLATEVDRIANEEGITIPIVIHADHYGIKTQEDIETAKTELPQMFAAGITSIAIDASHMSPAENVLANIELKDYIPEWAGLETEVGEIAGKEGMSTPQDAAFHMAALNAHGMFPDFIAVNNGSVHGETMDDKGIQVKLTRAIHDAVAKYSVYGAQHGTSGNSDEKLTSIRVDTDTIKANLATALMMMTFGVKVNKYGNAEKDENGYIKDPNQGVSEELWQEMLVAMDEQGLAIKQLNKPFNDKFLQESPEIQARMVKQVEDFITEYCNNVFNSAGSAMDVVERIISEDSFDIDRGVKRIEDPADYPLDLDSLNQIALDMGVTGARVEGDHDD